MVQAKRGGNVEGAIRSREREIGSQRGARAQAKLITGLHKFDVMSHFP